MKKLKDILENVFIVRYSGNLDRKVRSLCFDSRLAAKDVVFIALKGTTLDGHDYIPTAVAQGAKVIICETFPREIKRDVCYIEVKDSHEALGLAATGFYNYPSQNLSLIGVTGTNGKTTVATLLYRLVRSLGYKAGLISTISIMIEEKLKYASHTTPDPLQINLALSEMITAGCDYAFMEVSSHATSQKRIAGLTFSGGIFTNITHDHLDYHRNFSGYLQAKKSFFDNLPKEAFALYNADDRNGHIMIQNSKAAKYSYGMKTMSDFRASVVESQLDGSLLRIGNKELWTRLPGIFNAYNILAVYSTAILMGMKEESVLAKLSEQTSVSGRFEIIKSERGITGIVDYAHTPDALENVLTTIQKIRAEANRIITIVGAGGNRDKGKRPVMAKIAAELSDKIILTSDNPRNEKPEDIISEMKKGVHPDHDRKLMCITDREEAIRTACAFAEVGDIILLAGKGHETYQEIKGVRKHFDDKEMLTKYL